MSFETRLRVFQVFTVFMVITVWVLMTDKVLKGGDRAPRIYMGNPGGSLETTD